MEINIPKDGAVLVIDDQINEALPLIQALNKNCIPTFWFDGKDQNLPDSKLQKVRVAFVDLQLFPMGTPHDYAQKILGLFDKLLSPKNGPFVLIIWSTTVNTNADELESQITAEDFNQSPITCLRLNKTDYFDTVFDEEAYQNYIEYLDEELGNFLDEDDFDIIKGRTETYYSQFTFLQAKDNVLEKIFKEIERKLKKLQSFNLLTHWEDLVHKATSNVVNDYSSFFPPDEHWDNNLKHIFKKIAKSRIGSNIKRASKKSIVRNSYRSLNHSLSDQVDKIELKSGFLSNLTDFKPRFVFSYLDDLGDVYAFRKLKDGKYTLYRNGLKLVQKKENRVNTFRHTVQSAYKSSVTEAVNQFTNVTPNLNTIFLIDSHPSNEIYPGNIYKKDVDGRSKRRLLKTYIDSNKVSDADKNEIDSIEFIEMEISPICDYANDKWLKSRLLPGIMLPITNNLKVDFKRGSISSFIPPFYFQNELYLIAFDYRLMKALDVNMVKKFKPFLRLKKEPLTDLINQQAHHISRVGFTVVD